MKILFLTDLHFSQDPLSYNEALMLVSQERPDVLLLGGDFDNRELAEKFLNEAVRWCSLVLYILGNNDEFDFLNVRHAEHLDADVIVKLRDDACVAFCGISRNIALSEKPFRKLSWMYLYDANRISSLIFRSRKMFDLTILMIHEVPRELAEVAKQRGIIQAFNEKIVNTVTEAVKTVLPDIVLTGHLHAEYLVAEGEYDGKKVTYILTCWTKYRTYAEINVDKEHGWFVRVLKFPNVAEPLETIVCPKPEPAETEPE